MHSALCAVLQKGSYVLCCAVQGELEWLNAMLSTLQVGCCVRNTHMLQLVHFL